MMNVVHVRDGDTGQRQGDRFERLIVRCRDIAVGQLGAAVKVMMDQVDDALFELAEKSENNALQRTYFDAMREVRLKREQIEKTYEDALLAAFDASVRGERPALAGDTVVSLQQLSLVDDESVEEEIAVANMAARIVTTGRDELYALEQRMALLLRRKDCQGDDNPLAPKAICQAMREAVRHVDSGIEVRLLLLKLFDRYVVARAPAIYHEVNGYLIEHNVLPQIRTTVRRQPGPAVRPGVPAMAGAAEPIDQAAAAGLLQALLTGHAPAGSAAVGWVQGVPSAPLAGAVDTLTRLQQGELDPSGAGIEGVDPGAMASGTVNVLRALPGSGVFAGVETPQRIVVDVVAMLFDYILDDQSLPEGIRALIGRLQIPVVKVALLDAEFFSRKSHPVRRLLNLISEAVAEHGETPEALQILHEELARLVQRILEEFDDDVGLFTELAEGFERFVVSDLPARLARTERTRKVVAGRERLEAAKLAARDAVERCMARHGRHELVYEFLLSHWKSLLITTHVEYGEDSAEYARAVQTMDDLAWSVKDGHDADGRRRLTAMLPGLVSRLRQGLQAVSAPPVAQRRFLDKLAACHADAIRAPAADRIVPRGNVDVDLGGTAAEATAPGAQAGTSAPPPADDTAAPAQERAATSATAVDPEMLDRTVPDPDRPGTDDALEATRPEPVVEQRPVLADAVDPPVPAASPEPDGLAALLRERLERDGAVCLGDILPADAVVAGRECDEPVDVDAAFDAMLTSGSFEVEEITLGEADLEADIARETGTDLLAKVRPGSWLEVQGADGRAQRVQVKWINGSTGAYVLTDADGRQVAERSRPGLLLDLRRGSARVLEDEPGAAPLMERAFARLLDGLGGGK